MKTALKIVGLLLLLLVLGVAAAFGWLATATGQAYTRNLVKTQLSEAAGYAITAEGLRFSFPLNANIAHLELADSTGAWLTADNVALSVLPTPGIARHLVIRNVTADAVSLLRLPLTDDKEKEKPSEGGLDVSISTIAFATAHIPAVITHLPDDFTGSLGGSLGWSASAQNLALDLTAHMQQGIPKLAEADLSAKAEMDLGKNTLALNDITLTHPAITASGEVSLNQTTEVLDGKFSATLPNLAAWSPEAKGSAEFGIALTGTSVAPHIEASLAASNLAYQEKTLPNTTAQVSATAETGGAVSGLASLSTADDGGLTTRFRYAMPELSLSDLAAAYREATLKAASLTINTDTLRATGTATLAVPDLTRFSDYLPEGYSGAATAEATLSAPAQAQAADIAFTASHLRTPYGTLAEGKGSATLSDIIALPDRVNLTAQGFTQGNITLSRTTLAATRKGETWHADLATQGSLPQDISASANADIRKTTNGYAIALPSLKGSFDSHAFKTLSPANVTMEGDTLRAEMSRFAYGQGQYALAATRTATDITATLKGSNIAAADLMQKPARELASARASLALSLSGALASPEAKADISVANLTLAPKAPAGSLKANATLAKGEAGLQATLAQGKAATSKLKAQLPVQFSLEPFAFAIADSAPLRGNATLSLNVDSLSKAFLPPPHLLTGQLKADIALGGSYAAPAVTGPVSFTGGQYSYPDLGLTLKDLAFRATAKNTSLALEKFTAADGRGHTLSGKGNAALSPLKYDAQFTTHDFVLLRHPNVRGQYSADIALSGDSAGGLIKGEIRNEQTDINLPDRVVGQVPQLNIVRTIPARKSDKAKPAMVKPAYPMALDMTFKAANKVFVRGRGVDAEMQGNLAIQGQAAKPDITGKLSTVRGRYEQFGKQFTLATAELTFLGDIPPSPFLNIVASLKVGSNDIRPTITGPLLKPAVSIESTPAMPQEEALSLLLFGQGAQKLSAFQAVQLANSLAELTGHGGGGFDPVGKLRKLIGVDDITIKNDDATPDPTVGVGKYIGDKVYLQMEQTTGQNPGSKAKVEVEITPGISVESGASVTGASSVGVNWKHDY